MAARRVAVTGIGVISPIGTSTEQFWANCLQARSAVSPIPDQWRQYADFKSSIWSPLPEIDYAAYGLTRVERMQTDPVSLIAMCAAREAIENAGLSISLKNKRANTYAIEGIDSSRAAVFMGTGTGGVKSFHENDAHNVLARPKNALKQLTQELPLTEEQASALQVILKRWDHILRFNPFVVSMLMPNAVSAILGIKFSISGPNTTYAMACASGTVSIGQAFRAIRSGQVDMALSGGSEYLDNDCGGIFRGFDIANTLVQDCEDPQTANRPFDEKRSGFLFSQGGTAVLVLEEYEGARRRDAPIIAEVSGYAETFDAYSMMSIASEGAEIERMMRLALADAQLAPGDIDYINAHGTGTQLNDMTEATVIERVFGKDVLVNATKSLLGHTIGASGALEAAVTALSLQHQTTHVCKNLEQPISDLDFVRSPGPREISAALSQSFAFGGHNAALVLQRAEN